MNKYTVSLYKHSLVGCNIRKRVGCWERMYKLAETNTWGRLGIANTWVMLVVANTWKQPEQGKQMFGFECQARYFERHDP